MALPRAFRIPEPCNLSLFSESVFSSVSCSREFCWFIHPQCNRREEAWQSELQRQCKLARMALVGILFCVSDQFLTWTKFPRVFFLGADTFQALCVDRNSWSRSAAALWVQSQTTAERGACLNVFCKQQGVWTLLVEKTTSPAEQRGLHKWICSSSRSFLHSLCWLCHCSNVPHLCSYASVEVS